MAGFDELDRSARLSAPTDPQLMIRVLGPIDVVTRDGVHVIGSRHERMLLAALAVSANHATSADHLAQILWEDRPPPSRDNTLQTHVTRLRHLVGRRLISRENHSYQLNVELEQLDALVFEKIAAHASDARDRPAECLELCQRALSYWRGSPFGDLADIEPFRLEAIRLDELRLFVMELQLTCLIRLGREEMVVGTLQALVEEYPYRERMWYLLIEALALSGRRVEALRACRDLRNLLAEVGLESSAEIEQLEDSILSADPRLRPKLDLADTNNNS